VTCDIKAHSAAVTDGRDRAAARAMVPAKHASLVTSAADGANARPR
jgi:hypothetical protein